MLEHRQEEEAQLTTSLPAATEEATVTQAQDHVLEACLAEIGKESRRRSVLSVAFICVSALLLFLVSGRDLVSSILWPGIAVSILSYAYGTWFQSSDAASRLCNLDDKRCIGALIDVWHDDGIVKYGPTTRKVAAKALTRLLSRFNAEDGALLDEERRKRLREVLAHGWFIGFGRRHGPEFTVAVMQALAQIGDWKSEPLVRALTITSKNSKVREAAETYLPYLQEVVVKQKVSAALLRASAAPAETKSETLLRAAHATASTDESEQLLRASEDGSWQA